jgi:REP element-mobilizing transposase RayT
VVARQPRIEGGGLIHHVTGHSNPEVAAFPDVAAIRGFLALLAGIAETHEWHVYAYSVLTTHYHLLLETAVPNLGHGMRRLHGLHASRLNHRFERSGRLWRDRFHNRIVTSAEHVVHAAAYIDVNPVAAGLCRYANGWKWSSYRANAGLAEPAIWHRVDRLYAFMGAPPEEAPGIYRELVEASVAAVFARRALGDSPLGTVPRGLSPEGTVA